MAPELPPQLPPPITVHYDSDRIERPVVVDINAIPGDLEAEPPSAVIAFDGATSEPPIVMELNRDELDVAHDASLVVTWDPSSGIEPHILAHAFGDFASLSGAASEALRGNSSRLVSVAFEPTNVTAPIVIPRRR